MFNGSFIEIKLQKSLFMSYSLNLQSFVTIWLVQSSTIQAEIY